MDTIRWIPGFCVLKLSELALDAGAGINDDSKDMSLRWIAASPFMITGLGARLLGCWISGPQEAHPQRGSYIQRINAK